MTRATTKLLGGDLSGAIALNPLYVAGLALLLLYNLYAAAVVIGRLPRLRPRIPGSVMGAKLRWGIVSVIALNWAWLILRGV
jgi:hypothetical protein